MTFFCQLKAVKVLVHATLAGACRGMKCNRALSPTFSTTPFSPTFGATPDILKATPDFEDPQHC